jgi:hypothetical protein
MPPWLFNREKERLGHRDEEFLISYQQEKDSERFEKSPPQSSENSYGEYQ